MDQELLSSDAGFTVVGSKVLKDGSIFVFGGVPGVSLDNDPCIGGYRVFPAENKVQCFGDAETAKAYYREWYDQDNLQHNDKAGNVYLATFEGVPKDASGTGRRFGVIKITPEGTSELILEKPADVSSMELLAVTDGGMILVKNKLSSGTEALRLYAADMKSAKSVVGEYGANIGEKFLFTINDYKVFVYGEDLVKEEIPCADSEGNDRACNFSASDILSQDIADGKVRIMSRDEMYTIDFTGKTASVADVGAGRQIYAAQFTSEGLVYASNEGVFYRQPAASQGLRLTADAEEETALMADVECYSLAKVGDRILFSGQDSSLKYVSGAYDLTTGEVQKNDAESKMEISAL